MNARRYVKDVDRSRVAVDIILRQFALQLEDWYNQLKRDKEDQKEAVKRKRLEVYAFLFDSTRYMLTTRPTVLRENFVRKGGMKNWD